MLKKILAHEALMLFCALLFGALVLPTLSMVVLSFFGLIPRNESLAEGYAALRGHLQGRMWVLYLAVFGPYLAVQGARFVNWKRSGGPWYTERKPEGTDRRDAGSGEFARMSWRDGWADAWTRRPKSVKPSGRASPRHRSNTPHQRQPEDGTPSMNADSGKRSGPA